ncbi:hypothetical protein PILCRDRAFT_113481 [Piloderma croceum F 1598]|uniref:Uncharacterized protein n=1 Tax=Piloderma croceum (strain F 1598) TaxID=765440 RepID=A0A0C3C016_PILCF|nr:hypothetical protein PILCRDRAFT_113481 [Piloderma croceum F 1598]
MRGGLCIDHVLYSIENFRSFWRRCSLADQWDLVLHYDRAYGERTQGHISCYLNYKPLLHLSCRFKFIIQTGRDKSPWDPVLQVLVVVVRIVPTRLCADADTCVRL